MDKNVNYSLNTQNIKKLTGKSLIYFKDNLKLPIQNRAPKISSSQFHLNSHGKSKFYGNGIHKRFPFYAECITLTATATVRHQLLSI